MSSGPSQPQHRQHDSGVIADVVYAQTFPKICREIGTDKEVKGELLTQPVRRGYDDVIIGFISGVSTGAAFVDGGSLNATVRELHLSRPEIVADKIRTLFLVDSIPVNIILHKVEICDPVLAVFDALVKSHDKHDLVTLFVIPPVHLSPNFEAWMKARNAQGEVRGQVQIFINRAWSASEDSEQKPQRTA